MQIRACGVTRARGRAPSASLRGGGARGPRGGSLLPRTPLSNPGATPFAPSPTHPCLHSPFPTPIAQPLACAAPYPRFGRTPLPSPAPRGPGQCLGFLPRPLVPRIELHSQERALTPPTSAIPWPRSTPSGPQARPACRAWLVGPLFLPYPTPHTHGLSQGSAQARAQCLRLVLAWLTSPTRGRAGPLGLGYRPRPPHNAVPGKLKKRFSEMR